jgi:hypothetical protein
LSQEPYRDIIISTIFSQRQQKIDDDHQSVLDRMIKGAILHVKGLPGNTVGVEIREFFTAAYAEYEKGDEEVSVCSVLLLPVGTG